MNENTKLIRLLDWLESSGRSKAWFARTIGYSYQTNWDKLEGNSPLNDQYVTRCFSNVPDLPDDIFEEHGYRKDGNRIIKVIWLEEAKSEVGEKATAS